jgi:hypothetical protein
LAPRQTLSLASDQRIGSDTCTKLLDFVVIGQSVVSQNCLNLIAALTHLGQQLQKSITLTILTMKVGGRRILNMAEPTSIAPTILIMLIFLEALDKILQRFQELTISVG